MSPRLCALLLAVVALLATASAAPVGATPPESPVDVSPRGPAAEGPVTENATYEIQVEADGDARFTVSTWFDLEDEIDRRTFAEIAERFEAGEYSDLGLSTFREARAVATQQTGREMRIVDVARSRSPQSAIENGTGRLSVSFTWTNFARRPDNGTLAIGDAFSTANGTWFSGLTANQSLRITPPEGYRVSSSTVPITDGSLHWTGPQSFEPETLSATFTGDPGGPDPPDGVPWTVVIGLLVVLLVLALGGVFLSDAGPTRIREALGGASADDAADEPEAPDPGRAPEDPEPVADSAEPEVDAELLSDEERVERLLERNGGRMKQANIVKETGWSNAKVSQLLSAMEEEDRIDKLRIGRENLISFPDEDVTDVEG